MTIHYSLPAEDTDVVSRREDGNEGEGEGEGEENDEENDEDDDKEDKEEDKDEEAEEDEDEEDEKEGEEDSEGGSEGEGEDEDGDGDGDEDKEGDGDSHVDQYFVGASGCPTALISNALPHYSHLSDILATPSRGMVACELLPRKRIPVVQAVASREHSTIWRMMKTSSLHSNAGFSCGHK